MIAMIVAWNTSCICQLQDRPYENWLYEALSEYAVMLFTCLISIAYLSSNLQRIVIEWEFSVTFE